MRLSGSAIASSNPVEDDSHAEHEHRNRQRQQRRLKSTNLDAHRAVSASVHYRERVDQH